MSKKIVGAADSFAVRQSTGGSWAKGDSSEGDRSWKLVYAEALDSISRSGPATDPWSAASPALPFLVTPLPADKIVTETVTLDPLEEDSSEFIAVSTLPTPNTATPPINADAINGSAVGFASSFEAGFHAAFLRGLGATVNAPQAATDSIKPNASVSGQSVRAAHQSYPNTSAESIKPVAHPTKSGTGRLRDISLSIRVTSLEATQLKRKAAEAGTTVSAYLRQCVFDIERLSNDADETRAEMELLRRSILRAPREFETKPIELGTRSGAQKLATRALRLLGIAPASA